MAVYDNRHSRRVALLKVVLPLVALAILSTLFLVADRRGSGQAVPFSSVELDQLAAGQQIAGPNYTTVTEDGTAVTLAARNVAPDGETPDGMAARNLIAVVESPEGARLDLTAQDGTLATGADVARLVGEVALRSSTGYRLRGDAFDISRRTGEVTSGGAVTGTGPPGRLEAGRLSAVRRNGDYVLNFTGGVKLIYQPPDGNGE